MLTGNTKRCLLLQRWVLIVGLTLSDVTMQQQYENTIKCLALVLKTAFHFYSTGDAMKIINFCTVLGYRKNNI